MKKLIGISLFSNVGIAETYIHDKYVDFILANELLEDRAKVYKHFYPKTKMLQGDINKFKNQIIEIGKNKKVDFVLATPPCQGMSLAGKRKKFDIRNNLIKTTIEIILKIEPKYAIIENVPQALKTIIIDKNQEISILDFILKKLSKKYSFSNKLIVDAADYGVPQHRKRSIIILSRKDQFKWEQPDPIEKHITLKDVIFDLPSLEPIQKEMFNKQTILKTNIKYHNIPVHPLRQIIAMSHTPTGATAHNNKKFYPRRVDGKKVKGYQTTYKRMSWDKPAPTVTMANGSISSQNNVHPGHKLKNGKYSDPRVLTLLELFRVTGLPDNWNLPNNISDNFVRKVIGEGIPPLILQKIFKFNNRG